MTAPPATEPVSTPAQRFVWCLYDFGNSAYPTVIITAVYAVYYCKDVVGGDQGDKWWGIATSLGALCVFLAAPILGTLADRRRQKRLMLALHAWLCALATLGLAFTGPGTVMLATTLIVVGLYAFEAANVFYNAFLTELVPPQRMPRLSAAGWACGYVGGLGCLVAVLPLAESNPRQVPLVVALWFVVFTAPTLLLLRDRDGPTHAGRGPSLVERLRALRGHPTLLRFLAALFFYMNALDTVYVFAARFAQKTLLFSMRELVVLIIVMNVVAAPGAWLAGRIAGRIGAKRTIELTLIVWLVAIGAAVVAAWPGILELSARQTLFWGVAVLASLCIGGTQATSRTFVGQIAPAGQSGEFFGMMAFAGRASAILGPLVFGIVSDTTGDQGWAVASIGVFFLVGLVLLRRVPDRVAASS